MISASVMHKTQVIDSICTVVANELNTFGVESIG